MVSVFSGKQPVIFDKFLVRKFLYVSSNEIPFFDTEIFTKLVPRFEPSIKNWTTCCCSLAHKGLQKRHFLNSVSPISSPEIL